MISDLFEYEYLQRTIICGAIIGILCATVGVYVILRSMSFLGAGISHSALGGTAISVAIGSNILFTSFIFCMFIAWIIGFLTEKTKLKIDAAIGILFAFSQALGIFIFSLTPVYRTDLNSYLFGNIMSIGKSELTLCIVVTIIVLFFVFLFYRQLNSFIFDKEFAKVCGINIRFLHYMLLALIALTVVVSMQIVGILLVSALIVIPPTAASLITKRMGSTLTLSAIFGTISSILGICISYHLNAAPGPVIVLVSSAIFILCFIFHRHKLRKNE